MHSENQTVQSGTAGTICPSLAEFSRKHRNSNLPRPDNYSFFRYPPRKKYHPASLLKFIRACEDLTKILKKAKRVSCRPIAISPYDFRGGPRRPDIRQIDFHDFWIIENLIISQLNGEKNGELVINSKLPNVFHIKNGEDGSLSFILKLYFVDGKWYGGSYTEIKNVEPGSRIFNKMTVN
jgi:hypothetical protein